MSDTEEKLENPAEQQARQKLFRPLSKEIPGLTLKHIVFSPYTIPEEPDGKQNRTHIYLGNTPQHVAALKAVKAATWDALAKSMDTATGASVKTLVIDKGNSAELIFDGTMKDIAEMDQKAFNAALKKHLPQGQKAKA